jgi:site-specific DNA-methyltransferase (adenine-specific)/site-specific DNA-methyltransferase (cytosine-N4-specific)
LDDDSIDLVVTSPPYAEQREDYYDGPPEEEYPEWFKQRMNALYRKLRPHASVISIMRTHVFEGAISLYILRTRLAMAEFMWVEPEELIWHKPDAPPLGSNDNPRRTWEQMLWFAKKGQKPYIDLTACGNTKSTRLGFTGSDLFGSLFKGGTSEMESGTARLTDVFTAMVSEIDRNIRHPAKYPRNLVRQVIRTFTRPGDVVFDPFMGSGTTGLAAVEENRHYIGCDKKEEYVLLARKRLANR